MAAIALLLEVGQPGPPQSVQLVGQGGEVVYVRLLLEVDMGCRLFCLGRLPVLQLVGQGEVVVVVVQQPVPPQPVPPQPVPPQAVQLVGQGEVVVEQPGPPQAAIATATWAAATAVSPVVVPRSGRPASVVPCSVVI
jgi:hypothetical protein